MAEEAKRKIDQLLATNIQPEGFGCTVHDAIASSMAQPDDLLDPSYWAHVAAKLNPWDIVRIRSEDGAWYAQVLVLDAQRTGARVKFLAGPIDLKDQIGLPAEALAQFKVLHRGPRGWSVVRESDKSVLVENKATRGEADEWLRENFYLISKQAA